MYISNKKREKIVKRINKNYTLRKLLIAFSLFSLMTVFIFSILGFTLGETHNWLLWWEDGKIGAMGAVMIPLGAVGLVTSVFALIFTFTLSSPDEVKQDVSTLESSPIPGRKNSDSKSVAANVDERSMSMKEKEEIKRKTEEAIARYEKKKAKLEKEANQ